MRFQVSRKSKGQAFCDLISDEAGYKPDDWDSGIFFYRFC